MKTYVLDILNRIKRKSEELDAKTILMNKAWKIFNDDGEEETIRFCENGKLIISINGITTSGTWELFVEDKSIHITYEGQKNGILLKPKFDANGVLAMQLDGTNNYSFLIDKKSDNLKNIKTLSDLNIFYKQIEQAEEEKEKQEQLAIEASRAEEERERERLEKEKAEQEKQKRLEEKRLEEIKQKRLYIQKCKSERAEIAMKYSDVSKIFNVCNYSVEEVGNKLNVLYKNKNFLKFIRWYDLYKRDIYTGYNYDTHQMIGSLGVLVIVIFWDVAMASNSNLQENLALCIFVSIILHLLAAFCIWYLIDQVSAIVLNKRLQFLKKNENQYKWYYQIVLQNELLQSIDESKVTIKNNQIIDKYSEIVQKRQRIISKGILE